MTIWAGKKKPPALPSAVSTTYYGTTASSSTYGQDSPKHRVEDIDLRLHQP
jgi:hypothetical protein